MIKVGDGVVILTCLGRKIITVQEIIETTTGKYYKLKDCNTLYSESEVEEILPKKKEGLGFRAGIDWIIGELPKYPRMSCSEFLQFQEHTTNEHSYYTKDGKQMLSTWKMVNGVPTDVHEFEKVSPSNWKQLS